MLAEGGSLRLTRLLLRRARLDRARAHLGDRISLRRSPADCRRPGRSCASGRQTVPVTERRMHTYVEARLTEKIGETARKLRRAREMTRWRSTPASSSKTPPVSARRHSPPQVLVER